MNRLINAIIIAGCFLTMTAPVQAQQKRDLTPSDYTRWQSLGNTDLSPNGQWVAYGVSIQEGNDTVFVVNRSGNKTYKLEFASTFEFSKDNTWIAYRVGLPFKEAEKLRDDNKPIDYKMGLLNLETGKKEIIQNVSRFGFSRNGKFLAIYLAPPKDNKDKGAILLVRNLTDNTSRIIGNVTEYAFNKKSDYLAYITESANAAGNSAELFNLNNYTIRVLASDTSRFSKLAWQKEGEGLAFFKTFKKEGFEEENATIYAYTDIYKTPSLKIFDSTSIPDFPKDMRVYNGSSLSLSEDMNAVFFGIRAWTAKPKPSKAADSAKTKAADSVKSKDADTVKSKSDDLTIVKSTKDSTQRSPKPDKKDEKLASVDIWHWKDPEIQPHQKNTYNEDKENSWLSVWRLDQKTNNFHRLAADSTPIAELTGRQQNAILATDKKYKPAFKEDFADYYLADTRTGATRLIGARILAGSLTSPQSSPDGKFLVFFKDKNWWTYDIATGQTANITGDIKTDFWDIRDDHPASRPPVGFGGWIKGDKEFLVYDEYNVWALKPDGKGARKLTNGEKDEVQFRIYRVDNEDPFIDDSKPLYFTAYGDKSKKFGYYKLEKGVFTPLIFEDRQIYRLRRAKDAEAFTYVRSDFDISPELYVTGDFRAPVKVESTNPQQKDFFWGKSELISYTNTKGKPMQGALFYPANYQPGKKYPMIVYIYEILSNTVHGYTNPSERSPYNTANFTTQGYFVFRPDIVYDVNDPGISAVHCVVPAVEAVLKTGMIDKDKVGLMGHSWGAYQTSFIITQTDIFKAACAGAPLTDLVSMSMSIYWNSGTPDQKIFEISQGRFDGPWYERMQDHIRNSPMFNADKIKTPLLIAFGDKDGAVDWHQGIEMYGTMRRMEKPFVMLVYADENHGLAKKENQVDYQRRQREWFDYYLLGKPAPKWITEGTSYLDKTKEREKP